MFALHGLNVKSNRLSPYAKTPMYTMSFVSPDMFAIEYPIHTHNGFIFQRGIALQMEEHCHVIPVVGSIEPCDIDAAVSHAVSEVACVKRWLPVVLDKVLFPIDCGSNVPFSCA